MTKAFQFWTHSRQTCGWNAIIYATRYATIATKFVARGHKKFNQQPQIYTGKMQRNFSSLKFHRNARFRNSFVFFQSAHKWSLWNGTFPQILLEPIEMYWCLSIAERWIYWKSIFTRFYSLWENAHWICLLNECYTLVLWAWPKYHFCVYAFVCLKHRNWHDITAIRNRFEYCCGNMRLP